MIFQMSLHLQYDEVGDVWVLQDCTPAQYSTQIPVQTGAPHDQIRCNWMIHTDKTTHSRSTHGLFSTWTELFSD